MTKLLILSLAAATAMAVPGVLPAQSSAIAQQSLATRLDISATGTVSRVPDLAIISAGVVTKSATACTVHPRISSARGPSLRWPGHHR